MRYKLYFHLIVEDGILEKNLKVICSHFEILLEKIKFYIAIKSCLKNSKTSFFKENIELM